MTAFEPELGQMVFGNQWQEHEVPEIMEAVLNAIRDEYDRVYWNINQRECPSPFGNHGPGANLKTDVFEVCAYDWGGDEQPFNFAWRDLRISWYKYCGRGMSANMDISPDLAAQCLVECLASVRALEPDDENAPS